MTRVVVAACLMACCPLHAESKRETAQAQEIIRLSRENASLRSRLESLDASRVVYDSSSDQTIKRLTADNQKLKALNERLVKEGKRAIDATKVTVDATGEKVDQNVAVSEQNEKLLRDLSAILARQTQNEIDLENMQAHRDRLQLWAQLSLGIFAVLILAGIIFVVIGFRSIYRELTIRDQSRLDVAQKQVETSKELIDAVKADAAPGNGKHGQST